MLPVNCFCTTNVSIFFSQQSANEKAQNNSIRDRSVDILRNSGLGEPSNRNLAAPETSLKSLFPYDRFDSQTGISADDLRSGKFGSLDHRIVSDLEALPEGEPYVLMDWDSGDGSEVVWMSQNSGYTYFLGEPLLEAQERTAGPSDYVMNSDALEETAPQLSMMSLFPQGGFDPDVGISARDLLSGKFGELPPEIAEDIAVLPEGENYFLMDFNEGGMSDVVWMPQGGGYTYALGEPAIEAQESQHSNL